MAEPAKLTAAREHLSQAESSYRSAEGLVHLEEGLALLEEVLLDGTRDHRMVARNLLKAYSERICESVRKTVESDRGLPGPDLEHLFKVLLAFDATGSELPDYLPDYLASLKIAVVKRLIDLYYEGYPAEAKEKALRELTGIAGGGNG